MFRKIQKSNCFSVSDLRTYVEDDQFQFWIIYVLDFVFDSHLSENFVKMQWDKIFDKMI